MAQFENSSAMREPAAGQGKGKLWRVGTLTYTLGGLVVLFCWLLWGDFAWQMKERSIPSVVQLLFIKFQATDFQLGLLISSLPQALGLILGPIIAYKSDRHRGPWGRRIPFLLISTPFVVLGMLGLAFSPEMGGYLHLAAGERALGLNSAVLIFLALFWTMFEVATIIGNSVFSGLINDVVPHAVIGRFFGMFRAVSLLAAIGFNHWLFKEAREHYIWIFIGLAVLYGIGFALVGFRVKEGGYPAPSPAGPARGVVGFLLAAKGYFQECFGIPYYWWYYGYIAFSWMAFMPVNTFTLAFANSLHMRDADYGDCLSVTYAFSLIFAYPLGMLADRFHPLVLGLVVQALYAVVCLLGGLYATNPFGFGFALVAHGIVSGTWMTATASIGQRLLPKSQFAQFGSAGGIVSGLCAIMVAPSVGKFLEYTNHNYPCTFLISSGLELVALTCGVVLYYQFKAHGGPRNYVAPE